MQTKEITKTGKQWTTMLTQAGDQWSEAQHAAVKTAIDRVESGIRSAKFGDMFSDSDVEYKVLNAHITVAFPVA